VCICWCGNVHDCLHGFICVCVCVCYVTGGKQASVTSQIWHCAVTALHRFPKGKSDLEKHKLCRTTRWILNTEENWFRCVDVYVVLSKTNSHQCVKRKGTFITLHYIWFWHFLKIPWLSNKSANSKLSHIIFLNAHLLSVCLWQLVCKDSEFDRHCFSVMYHLYWAWNCQTISNVDIKPL